MNLLYDVSATPSQERHHPNKYQMLLLSFPPNTFWQLKVNKHEFFLFLKKKLSSTQIMITDKWQISCSPASFHDRILM